MSVTDIGYIQDMFMRAYVSTYLHKFKYGIYSYGGYGGCSQSSYMCLQY